MGSGMGRRMGIIVGPHRSATEVLDRRGMGAEAFEILDRFNVVERRFLETV